MLQRNCMVSLLSRNIKISRNLKDNNITVLIIIYGSEQDLSIGCNYVSEDDARGDKDKSDVTVLRREVLGRRQTFTHQQKSCIYIC